MKIQIRINEEGALRNQRHAFSNRFTLVSEPSTIAASSPGWVEAARKT